MITFSQEEAVFIYDALRFQNGRQRQFSDFTELEKHTNIYRKFKKEIIPIDQDGQKALTFKDGVKFDFSTEEKAAIIVIIKSEPWDVGKGDVALSVLEKLK